MEVQSASLKYFILLNHDNRYKLSLRQPCFVSCPHAEIALLKKHDVDVHDLVDGKEEKKTIVVKKCIFINTITSFLKILRYIRNIHGKTFIILWYESNNSTIPVKK